MREILFRGKRVSDGEWLLGSLICYTQKGELVCCIHGDYYSHAIDHETVGQYTGLRDKNEKKIFEGDILGIRIADRQYIEGVVKYGKFNCTCCYGVYGWYVEGQNATGDIRAVEDGLLEVIGNIHDNPELMEVQECHRSTEMR